MKSIKSQKNKRATKEVCNRCHQSFKLGNLTNHPNWTGLVCKGCSTEITNGQFSK